MGVVWLNDEAVRGQSHTSRLARGIKWSGRARCQLMATRQPCGCPMFTIWPERRFPCVRAFHNMDQENGRTRDAMLRHQLALQIEQGGGGVSCEALQTRSAPFLTLDVF